MFHMIVFSEKGIYCRPAACYIDPWAPVARAIVTHAHSDHALPGMGHYLCHRHTAEMLRLRLGPDIRIQEVDYGEPVTVGEVRISLHPAGHIFGSAQVRLEHRGGVWVVSGDYKLDAAGICEPYEPLHCHHFITESTFGLPIYRFPQPAAVCAEIHQWRSQTTDAGFNTVLSGSSLGKAQRLLRALDSEAGPVFLHGAVANINAVMEKFGYRFPGIRIAEGAYPEPGGGAVIVAPPSALSSPWLRKLAPYRVALCSGWMRLRGARRRRGVDRGFILSDHADWEQLGSAVAATGAEHVYVTHGYEHQFARWLREERHISAEAISLRGKAEGDEL